MALLEIDDIHVFYDNIEALKGVSITVDAKQIVTLVGANGAGKTTTLRAISGLLRPRSGEIRLEGESIGAVAPHAIAGKGMMQVPERRRIFARLTVEENLAMGAFTRHDRRQIAEDKERMLTLFPRLRERLKQVAGTLSGGEQQMVATARALMGRPRILLMDEPSMGLSPVMVEHVFETIRTINANGVTFLFVVKKGRWSLAVAFLGFGREGGRLVWRGGGGN